MGYNVAPGRLTQQPQRPVRVSKASGLAHGIGEVIVPHLGVSLVRRLPYTVRGTGIRQIPTPAGTALGMTAFSNSGSAVTGLDWPHHGFRLTPPCTYGCVAVLNSSSALNLISMFTSNNSGYRIRASGAAFVGEVTRSGATVAITDPSTVALGSVHTVLLVITTTALTLYVDGVNVASGAHSAYSAGGLASVSLAGTSAGGVANAGGCLMAASWPRALTAEDAATWAAQPWSILEDEDDVWTSSAAGAIDIATLSQPRVRLWGTVATSFGAAAQTLGLARERKAGSVGASPTHQAQTLGLARQRRSGSIGATALHQVDTIGLPRQRRAGSVGAGAGFAVGQVAAGARERCSGTVVADASFAGQVDMAPLARVRRSGVVDASWSSIPSVYVPSPLRFTSPSRMQSMRAGSRAQPFTSINRARHYTSPNRSLVLTSPARAN